MKRSYNQNCALAHALDVVGERWTLLIVRELLLGPRRYGELLDNLVGLGTNLLAQRLKEMKTAGLIDKHQGRYRLTSLGRSLEPAIQELVRFGLSLGFDDDERRVSRPEWDVVALKALYRPERDDGLSGRYVIELNGYPVHIEARDGRVDADPGDSDQASVRVALSKDVARRLANGESTFKTAADRGDLTIKGGRQEARKLLRAFSIVD